MSALGELQEWPANRLPVEAACLHPSLWVKHLMGEPVGRQSIARKESTADRTNPSYGLILGLVSRDGFPRPMLPRASQCKTKHC